MQSIILALSFALHFALMFLGVIISIYFDTWLGLLLVAFSGFKFFYMLPEYRGQYEN